MARAHSRMAKVAAQLPLRFTGGLDGLSSPDMDSFWYCYSYRHHRGHTPHADGICHKRHTLYLLDKRWHPIPVWEFEREVLSWYKNMQKIMDTMIKGII